MAGNPRENGKGKGFWDGGEAARGENGQSAGRPSGFPGQRRPSMTGVRSDIEFPTPSDNLDSERKDKA